MEDLCSDDDDWFVSQIVSDISDVEPSASRRGSSFSHNDGGCNRTVDDVETLGKLKWTFGLFHAGENDESLSSSPWVPVSVRVARPNWRTHRGLRD